MLFFGMIMGLVIGGLYWRSANARVISAIRPLVIVLILSVTTILILGNLGVVNTNILTNRYSTILTLDLTSAQDESANLRQIQFERAWSDFSESPLFGKGPAYSIEFMTKTPRGLWETSSINDTPAAFLAHFGIAGVAFAIAYVVRIIRWLHILKLSPVDQSFLVSFGLSVLFYAPFVDLSTDKGIGVAVALAVALVASRERSDELPGNRPFRQHHPSGDAL